jgi:hypothetical protein
MDGWMDGCIFLSVCLFVYRCVPVVVGIVEREGGKDGMMMNRSSELEHEQFEEGEGRVRLG